MENYKRKAALFLASQGVSLFGSSVVQFAIVWYVTLQTSSGFWVSLLTIAAYAPQFIVSFFAGALADRHSRKPLIILSDAGIALVTLSLLFILPYIGEGTPMMIALVIALAIRSIGTGIQTPAVSASVPLLVPADKLMKFNGINATIQAIVQFVAPAAAGAVLAFSTLSISLLIDIGTAAAGIGIMAAIAIPFKKNEESSSMMADIKGGISYAARDKFIGPLLAIFGLFIFLCVPAGFMATLFVERCYGDSYWDLTIVEVIGFVGMAGGGMLIGAWGGFKNRVKTLAVGMTAFGILSIGMAAVDNFIIYLILMVVYGIAITMIQTASTTLLQENTAPEMQGRVFGLFGAMFSGFLPLGMALFGPLADVMDMRLMMIITGVLLLIMAAFIFLKRSFYKHVSPQSLVNE